MTIKDALKSGTEKLKDSGIETPASEAGVVLCHVLNCQKVHLYTHGDGQMTEDQETIFFKKIEMRAKGIPAQYITGQQEFMSLNFNVNSNVLIPRPDTEILVESIINYSKRCEKQKLDILDIGTGSGCIAISLAYYIEKCNVVAIDISEGALETARGNANQNNVLKKIEFIKSYLFDEIKGKCFDVIISNPPYIPTSDIEGLQKEVRGFEPFIALDGGMDGLDFYRAITREAGEYLNEKGILAFEVGYDQGDSVASMMIAAGYCVEKLKDFSDIDRVIIGELKG